jgi:Fe-S cluster assembly protein SufD
MDRRNSGGVIAERGAEFAAAAAKSVAAVAAGLPGAGPIPAARRAALAAFEKEGWPTRAHAAWRLAPPIPLEREWTAAHSAPPPVRPASLAGVALCPLTFDRLVFINGRVCPELSYAPGQKGLTLTPLSQAIGDPAVAATLSRPVDAPTSFAHLAAAAWSDGALIRVAPGTVAARPVHLVFLSAPTPNASAAHVRTLIQVGAGASLTVVVERVGGAKMATWTNGLVEIELGEGAQLTHYKLERESPEGRRTTAVVVRGEARSSYKSCVFALGGAYSRNDLTVRLGEGASATLDGLSLLRGDEIGGHFTTVSHAAPGASTKELYKSVLDGRSRLVFEGMVRVQPGAQKTEASVYSRNLLLSDEAVVDANPEFKIYADDVSCRHGATIGRLSSESLFYLRSRGIGADESRRLLIYAFGAEMLERVALEPLRAALADALVERMPAGAAETSSAANIYNAGIKP